MGKQRIPQIGWTLYSSILTVIHDQIQEELNEATSEIGKTFQWFLPFERFLSTLKSRLLEWKELINKRSAIPSSLRILLRHKHYLQNRFWRMKSEEERLRLRAWHLLVRREPQSHRQR